jgi:hypothetical protein
LRVETVKKRSKITASKPCEGRTFSQCKAGKNLSFLFWGSLRVSEAEPWRILYG